MVTVVFFGCATSADSCFLKLRRDALKKYGTIGPLESDGSVMPDRLQVAKRLEIGFQVQQSLMHLAIAIVLS